jgi:hypothetical protein
MAYTIPGTNVSTEDLANAASKATAALSIPKMTDMIGSVKSGAIFAGKAPDLSSLTALGIDTSSITGALKGAQDGLAENLMTVQAHIMDKAKAAAAEGKTLSPAEISSMMGPLAVFNKLGDMVSAAKEQATSLLAGLTDPLELASKISTFNSGLSSSMTALTAEATTAKVAAQGELVASGLVTALATPMIPQLKSIIEKQVDMSKIDLYSVEKHQTVAPVVELVPKKAITPDPAPSMNFQSAPPEVKAEDPVQKVFSSELSALAAEKKTVDQALADYVGVPADDLLSPTTEGKVRVAAAMDGLLTKWGFSAEDIDKHNKAVYIRTTKPDESTRTEEEAGIVKWNSTVYKSALFSNPGYIDYTTNYEAPAKKFHKWYAAAYDCWKKQKSRFTLEVALEQKLRSYS